MLMSTLTTSSTTNFVETILNLRLINIIKNRERKQKTRIYKYKQKH